MIEDAAVTALRDGFTVPQCTLANTPDFSRCRPVLLPDGTWSTIKDHAKIGVRALLANSYFALFDEMGNMKSAQTIIAAQFLNQQHIINRVIVLAPASVRAVWFDRELGELAKHLWLDQPHLITEYHSKIRQWRSGPERTSDRVMKWIITNYEFIARSKQRLAQLLQYCGPQTLLVLDESSAINSKHTLQTKSCQLLRSRCGRVVLLNGTPISNSPLDLLMQGNIMHPDILECKYLSLFRERYAIMETYTTFPKVKRWVNLDDLQRRFAPYVLRRLKKDCLDLPEKLPPVTLTVPLTPASWKAYKSMRDDMVTWVSSNTASLSMHAATKVMRLAQITSGFIGGVENILDDDDSLLSDDAPPVAVDTIHEVGREKLDFVLSFFQEHLDIDSNFKLLVWCKFRPEVFRVFNAVKAMYGPTVSTGILIGAQKKRERESFLRLLNPITAPKGPIFAVGTYGTGALGHNFTAVHTVVNASYDYSLKTFLQSADRVHRPGQVHAVSYFDIEAVGPAGQKTIDHDIILARRNKEDVATRTAAAWRRVLLAEDDGMALSA